MNKIKFARTPAPPYYAVIFLSQRSAVDEGYDDMAAYMDKLVRQQQGYLGHESFRDEDGFGVTISYWKDIESIKKWKNDAHHAQARNTGRSLWYQNYKLRICKVEHDYDYFV